MIRRLEIWALRRALSACLHIGFFAGWLAPRIAQRLQARAAGKAFRRK